MIKGMYIWCIGGNLVERDERLPRSVVFQETELSRELLAVEGVFP